MGFSKPRPVINIAEYIEGEEISDIRQEHIYGNVYNEIEAKIRLDSIDLDLALAEIYRRVRFENQL